jgi:hypothetical protein
MGEQENTSQQRSESSEARLARISDGFAGLGDVLVGRAQQAPWVVQKGRRILVPDVEALELLTTVAIRRGGRSETGRLARSIDMWVAEELRRAGFDEDEVWPRRDVPRVLPREVALLVSGLPKELRSRIWPHVLKRKAVAPADARILGRAYVKQVDVLIAQWSRGPELIVSTKSMTSSFRNNLPNRFEESYGDAKNLRGRYPLAATGFLFLMRSTTELTKPTLERACDMLRKLREGTDGYDATTMIIAEWPDLGGAVLDDVAVKLHQELVPDDLREGPFLEALIDRVLERTPIDMHVRVRELREGVDLAVAEESETEAQVPD